MSGRTDYNKIRERFLVRQKALADSDNRWWKPDQGRHKIRILPPLANHDSWFVEYGVHYSIGPDEFTQQTVTCPRLTLKKPCPICEFVRGLWRSGQEDDQALARRIGAKSRYCSNVIVLSRNKSEVRVWAYGPQVWDQLAELCVGEDGVIPIDDPSNGFNLSVVVTTRNTPEGNFPQYLVKPAEMKPVPLADKGVLNSMHDIVEMIHSNLKSYDEIRAILTGGEAPASEDISETREDEEHAPVETDDPEEVIPEQEADDAQEEKPSGQDLVKRARAALNRRGAR